MNEDKMCEAMHKAFGGPSLYPEQLCFEKGWEAAIESMQAEVDHWKANHDNQVAKAALLMQRHDLPVDRIPAYKELERLQKIVESMKVDAEPIGYVRAAFLGMLKERGIVGAFIRTDRQDAERVALYTSPQPAQEWISVKDRLPSEDEGRVLTVSADGMMDTLNLGEIGDSGSYMGDDWVVTHWIPLPPQPTKADDEN